ncbi:MAG: endonuclease/exonuclease/phosphatase family protein [Phycisphaeraceae bacterium]
MNKTTREMIFREGCSVCRWVVVGCLLVAAIMAGCQAKDPRDPNDPTLRVMSFNLRVSNIGDSIIGRGWNGRKGDVVKIIKAYDPDLLGTQEGKNSQVKYLKKKLKWYKVHGAGRDDGRRGGEFCAIYYRTIRFTSEDSGHIWFNDSGRPGKRTWGSIFPRMASWIRLHDEFTGQTVLAVNTHLDVISSESRVRSARMIRQLIDQHPDAYVILTGDFNCDIGSEPFRILAGNRQRRLIDTYTAAGHKDGRMDGTRHGFHGSKGGDRIDWILVSPTIRVKDARIVRDKPFFDGYPSDHFPVTADLVLPKAE